MGAPGCKHSQDTATLIPRQLVLEMATWVMENHAWLTMLFQIKDRSKVEERELKIILDVINKVLYKWSGTRLTPVTKDRNKMALTYRLTTDYPLYNIVRKPSTG